MNKLYPLPLTLVKERFFKFVIDVVIVVVVIVVVVVMINP